MIRKITLLFLLCVGMQPMLQAQQCGYDNVKQRLAAQDPMFAQKFQQAATDWANWYNSNHNPSAMLVNNGTKVFEIPVVVHIVMPGNIGANPPGSTYDPSDAQITALIDYVNQTYNASWGAYPDINNGGTSIPVRFVLAKRNPNCTSTTGIVRVDGSSVNNYVSGGVDNGSTIGASELSVKNLSRWPVDQYYNIWIVNRIDGNNGVGPGVFTAGYAYLPPAPSNLDGCILLASQAVAGNVNLPHELAHALSVLHTFEGGSVTACPPTSPFTCLTTGDLICDTEPEKNSNFTCPVDPNPCTGGSYNNVQHNFMDYSSCQNRFTDGQKMRMIWGLTNYRGGLIGSWGGVAPGLNATASCNTVITNPGNTFDAGVYNVKIQDNFSSPAIGNIPYVYLDYASGGYNTDGNLAHVDRTCRQIANLITGSTYKFFVKAGPTAGGEKVRIYLDYDGDGNFSAAEMVYSNNGTTANELDSALIAMPTSTTMPTLVTCLPIRMRVISDRTSNTTINPCVVENGQAEDYTVVLRGSGVTATVNNSLPPLMQTTCIGDTLVFTAIPSAGASGPITYEWYENTVFTGATGLTYSTSTIANGTSVTVKMYYTNQCGTLDNTISNAIVVSRVLTLAPQVNIALTVGNNPGCPGYPVTFTAAPYNGGLTPSYQWYKNGVAIIGATNVNYTSSTLSSGDSISCQMTSSSPCANPTTAVSNKIGIQHYVLTSNITITATPNPSCSGDNILLQATPVNAGAGASYQWFRNGIALSGATSLIYFSTNFVDGDNIICVMNASSLCVINHLDTSNQIALTIKPTLSSYVHDSISIGNNPGCLDSLLVFGARADNLGNNVDFWWTVNGFDLGPTFHGTSFSSSTLKNGDVIYVGVAKDSNDLGCYSADTLYGEPITLVLTKTPDPPIISLIGNLLFANNVGTYYKWFGPPSGNLIPGATGYSYHPTVKGFYWAQVVDIECPSPNSNVINVSLLDIESFDIASVKIAPNPSDGKLTLDWGTDVTMTIKVYNSIGQQIIIDEINNESRKTLDLTAYANGNYFIVIRDEHGNTGTVPVTLLK